MPDARPQAPFEGNFAGRGLSHHAGMAPGRVIVVLTLADEGRLEKGK
jgi:hypothetical protein